MDCPNCHKTFTHQFDKFSIEKQKRCSDCQKEWASLPQNEPENKKFVITWVYKESDSQVIYAKTEQDAIKQFKAEDMIGREIDSIEEIKNRS